MTAITAIAKIFGTKLKEFSTANAIRVAYENANFAPAPNETWIGESLVPILRKPLTVSQNGMTVDIGLYDITVNVPINTTKFKALDMASKIGNFFAVGTSLSIVVDSKPYTMRIMNVYTGRGFTLNNFYTLPVTIEYKMLSNG